MNVTITLKKQNSTTAVVCDVPLNELQHISLTFEESRSDTEWSASIVEDCANILRSHKSLSILVGDGVVRQTLVALTGLLVDASKMDSESIIIDIDVVNNYTIAYGSKNSTQVTQNGNEVEHVLH